MCHNILLTEYVVFATMLTDWCLEPSKEQAAAIWASAQTCLFFALPAAVLQGEKSLLVSYSDLQRVPWRQKWAWWKEYLAVMKLRKDTSQKLRKDTSQGFSPSSHWVVTVWQWSEQELHVNSSRHLAKSLSLQSVGLFLLKSKDKLSETRYYIIGLVMQMKTDFWFYYLCHGQITFHNYIKNQLNHILFVWFFLLQIYELYFLWPGSDLESIPPYVDFFPGQLQLHLTDVEILVFSHFCSHIP